jgi:hypothetical protein
MEQCPHCHAFVLVRTEDDPRYTLKQELQGLLQHMAAAGSWSYGLRFCHRLFHDDHNHDKDDVRAAADVVALFGGVGDAAGLTQAYQTAKLVGDTFLEAVYGDRLGALEHRLTGGLRGEASVAINRVAEKLGVQL